MAADAVVVDATAEQTSSVSMARVYSAKHSDRQLVPRLNGLGTG